METVNLFSHSLSITHGCSSVLSSPPAMESGQCLFQARCYWKTDVCRDCSGLTPGMLKSFQADLSNWKMSLSLMEGGLGGKWYPIREPSHLHCPPGHEPSSLTAHPDSLDDALDSTQQSVLMSKHAGPPLETLFLRSLLFSPLPLRCSVVKGMAIYSVPSSPFSVAYWVTVLIVLLLLCF